MFFHNVIISSLLSTCLLYLPPDIIRQIKSRRMRWAGHVAHMGEEREVYRFLVGKPKGKRPLQRLGIDWRMGLGWILWR
jgi:hypothetical protein